ncbi:MAG: DUF2970 domain-containing protein [Gammaproteobacteria bacterium]|nr:DUF2970 domain-containing protein [Gammaproteobacteria bacterium]
MWFYRIISSFLGIRKKIDLKNDLKRLSLKKIIILFIALNIIFICIVLIITRIILHNL